MKLSDTTFMKTIPENDIKLMQDIASRNGISLGTLLRLGYDACTGPYRFHLSLIPQEKAALDSLVASQNVSRSEFLMNIIETVIQNPEAKLLLHSKLFLPLHYTSPYPIDIGFSINRIDLILQLESLQRESKASMKTVIRECLLLHPDFQKSLYRIIKENANGTEENKPE